MLLTLWCSDIPVMAYWTSHLVTRESCKPISVSMVMMRHLLLRYKRMGILLREVHPIKYRVTIMILRSHDTQNVHRVAQKCARQDAPLPSVGPCALLNKCDKYDV